MLSSSCSALSSGALSPENYLSKAPLSTGLRAVQPLEGTGEWPRCRKKSEVRAAILTLPYRWPLSPACVLPMAPAPCWYIAPSWSQLPREASFVLLLLLSSPGSLSWVLPALGLVVASCLGTDQVISLYVLGFSAVPVSLELHPDINLSCKLPFMASSFLTGPWPMQYLTKTCHR